MGRGGAHGRKGASLSLLLIIRPFCRTLFAPRPVLTHGGSDETASHPHPAPTQEVTEGRSPEPHPGLRVCGPALCPPLARVPAHKSICLFNSPGSPMPGQDRDKTTIVCPPGAHNDQAPCRRHTGQGRPLRQSQGTNVHTQGVLGRATTEACGARRCAGEEPQQEGGPSGMGHAIRD